MRLSPNTHTLGLLSPQGGVRHGGAYDRQHCNRGLKTCPSSGASSHLPKVSLLCHLVIARDDAAQGTEPELCSMEFQGIELRATPLSFL